MLDAQTIQRLNQINHDFYATVADEFDQTRGTAWLGWERLRHYLHAPLRVLDVGCGNGRFGLFVHEQLEQLHPNRDQHKALLEYHGIDSNADLLQHAHHALSLKTRLSFRLEQRDIVQNPPDEGYYDLVVLLGVLHHIPGYAARQQFMRTLADRIAAGGMLVIAAWRFYEYERFRQRIVPWPEDIQVEAHDYLLDWRRGAFSLRYCHYTDDDEFDRLIHVTGLSEIERYRADGQSGDANLYSILKK